MSSLKHRNRLEYLLKLAEESEINSFFSNHFKDFSKEELSAQLEFILSLKEEIFARQSAIFANLFKYKPELISKLCEAEPSILVQLQVCPEILKKVLEQNENFYRFYLIQEQSVTSNSLININLYFLHKIKTIEDLLSLDNVDLIVLMQAIKYADSIKPNEPTLRQFTTAHAEKNLLKLLQYLTNLFKNKTYRNITEKNKIDYAVCCFNLSLFSKVLYPKISKGINEQEFPELIQFENLLRIIPLSLLINFYYSNDLEAWKTFFDTAIAGWISLHSSVLPIASIQKMFDKKIEAPELFSQVNWNFLVNHFIKLLADRSLSNYDEISKQIRYYIEQATIFGCVLNDVTKQKYKDIIQNLILLKIKNLESYLEAMTLRSFFLPFDFIMVTEILGETEACNLKNKFYNDLKKKIIEKYIPFPDDLRTLLNQLVIKHKAELFNPTAETTEIINFLISLTQDLLKDIEEPSSFIRNTRFLSFQTEETLSLFRLPTIEDYVATTLYAIADNNPHKALELIKHLIKVKSSFYLKLLKQNYLFNFELFKKIILESTKLPLPPQQVIKVLYNKLEDYKAKLNARDYEVALLEGYIALYTGSFIKAAEYFEQVRRAQRPPESSSDYVKQTFAKIFSMANAELGEMLFNGIITANFINQKIVFSIPDISTLSNLPMRAALAHYYLQYSDMPSAISLDTQSKHILNGNDECKPSAILGKVALNDHGRRCYEAIMMRFNFDPNKASKLVLDLTLENSSLISRIDKLEQQFSKMQNDIAKLAGSKSLSQTEIVTNRYSFHNQELLSENNNNKSNAPQAVIDEDNEINNIKTSPSP